MKEIQVEIVETLSRVITVDAENEDEALTLVWDMYNDEEIVLDSSDFVDTELKIFGE